MPCHREFRPEYRWIDAPVADDLNYLLSMNGASTMLPGRLYFCGPCSTSRPPTWADPGPIQVGA